MDIKRQIEAGLLVCPKTKQRLIISEDNKWLENESKTRRYPLVEGKIPVLVENAGWAQDYAASSARMNEEYRVEFLSNGQSPLGRFRSVLAKDYRAESSKKALLNLFEGCSEDSVCISIGGGPSRADPRLCNLNLWLFPNVEIVADAHCLPYADDSVDVVHSEAVFEHLYNPARAAQEIYRILRPGKKAYICTPFLQPYHGYPHHYQNYTITGHKLLFESAGFRIVESGTCVGPVYAIFSLIRTFFVEYFPFPINHMLRALWSASGLIIRPFDMLLNKRENAHVLASTTYIIAEKIYCVDRI